MASTPYSYSKSNQLGSKTRSTNQLSTSKGKLSKQILTTNQIQYPASASSIDQQRKRAKAKKRAPANDTDSPPDFVPEAAHSKVTRDSAEILEMDDKIRQSMNDEVTRDSAEILEMNNVPEAASDEVTRDSAEIIERSSEFKTSLTRDIAEVREHHMAEEGKSSKLDLYEIEAAGCLPEGCGSLATPGDIDSAFVKDRPESPPSAREFEMDQFGETACKKRRKRCKYFSVLNSGSISQWKKHEIEMKRKRKLLEKMHAKNHWLREKMKQRAREKRKMLRCRDRSKIPETQDNIYINKTYYFRFNYNKQLPCMPSTMNSHFEKYKKPPFKHFQRGLHTSYKHIDEFEKLRVCEKKK